MPTDYAPTKLATENRHERDAGITFQEEGHIYTVLGQLDFQSVTTVIHHMFGGFDAEKTAAMVVRGRKMQDPGYKYFGMTKQEIIDKWAADGASASFSGTRMHFNVEMTYNDEVVHDDSIEFQYFLNFKKDNPHLVPFRTEWMVYDEDVKICGSIDMVFFDNITKDYKIYDWKRCRKMTFENSFQTGTVPGITDNVDDTNFQHYTFQLNTYRKILETKYGLKVSDMRLVCMHPDNENGNYLEYPVADIQPLIEEIWERRRQAIAVGVYTKEFTMARACPRKGSVDFVDEEEDGDTRSTKKAKSSVMLDMCFL